ncbi:MAG TPA: electron transport complex subunit RsxA [Firmicutes bacterium]|nr:electron transport complex subunit RsxA [Bacillota bacterium]
MDLNRYFLIFLAAFLIQNILLIRFIALCSFFGISTSVETSVGMSLAVIFVMMVSSTLTWALWNFVLEPLGIGEFLYIPSFILVIAAFVQLEELFIKKTAPALYKAMGIYLPLITTNCAVLAAATEVAKPGFIKLSVAYHYTLPEAWVYTFGVALGYSAALLVFATLRERIDIAPVPPAMKGYPIAFITASLMSLALTGFAGLFGV